VIRSSRKLISEGASTVLEVESLHVRYGKVEVVHGIDVHIGQGQVVLMLGPNGAGKTTTLHAVAGVRRPYSGAVRLDAAVVTSLPAYKMVGRGVVLVPEGRRVFGQLSVIENLRLGGHLAPRHERSRTLSQVFEMFPVLFERRNSQAGLLSGGEQQMLAFGRALMSRPSYLLMDEPSMGLAPAMTAKVMDAVKEMSDSGIGMLMVEQNIEAGLAVADEVLVVSRGSVVYRGRQEEARRSESIILSFLGESAVAR
jgi:branched-chain amino acid transport system ATP-binding protein